MKNILKLLFLVAFISLSQAQSTDISIITNKNVDVTFEGEPCLLRRSIISTTKKVNTQNKRYVILTERVKYVKETVKIINEEGEEIEEVIDVLKVISKKDKESIRVFSFNEINGLYNAIKGQIPTGLSKMQTENIEEKIALLIITQQDKIYATQPQDWKIL